jgi:hypothetical protein
MGYLPDCMHARIRTTGTRNPDRVIRNPRQCSFKRLLYRWNTNLGLPPIESTAIILNS